MLLRSLPRLTDPGLGEGDPYRPEQDPKIQAERLVVDVPEVEREAALPRQPVAPVELRPAGDPGPHVVAPGLLARVARQVLHQERPRADQAHVAPDHVDQPGQLVQARATEEPAQAGQPGAVGQEPAVGGARAAHGAELVEDEGPPVPPRPALREDHRPAEQEPDPERGQDQERREHDQRDGGRHQIEGALGPARPPTVLHQAAPVASPATAAGFVRLTGRTGRPATTSGGTGTGGRNSETIAPSCWITAPVAPSSARCSRPATSRARCSADVSRAERTRLTPGRRDGSMVSSEATRSSESFSPGRIPV